MIVELISTGSELLLGDTVNTNVSWLAQELNKLGYTIAHQSVVGDNPKRMAEVFQLASTRADIVRRVILHVMYLPIQLVDLLCLIKRP